MVIVLIPFYVPPSRSFALVSFFLVITLIVLARKFWSGSKVPLPKTAIAADSNQPKLRENLANMISNVKSARRGSRYSQEEAARILRAALLNKFLGYGAFPQNWISTQNGKQALEKILDAKNSPDLIDILEPSSERLTKSEEYVVKLDLALKLIEEGGNGETA